MKKKNYSVITHEPVLGELRYGRELGRNTGQRFIFAACEVCGKTRWVEYRKGAITDKRCIHCVNKGRKFKLTHARTDIEAKVGDIKTGGELGMKCEGQKYIYEPCNNCGRSRWVQIQSSGKYNKCRKCHRIGYNCEQNGRWKGGRNIDAYGYVLVKLRPDDPYYPMATKSGYVKEHRLAIAKQLGRCLEKWEEVHHKGETFPVQSRRNKSDNIPENLLLVGSEGYNTMIEKTLIKLEAENIKLQSLLRVDMSEFI
jgi:hypothetical protein